MLSPKPGTMLGAFVSSSFPVFPFPFKLEFTLYKFLEVTLSPSQLKDILDLPKIAQTVTSCIEAR